MFYRVEYMNSFRLAPSLFLAGAIGLPVAPRLSSRNAPRWREFQQTVPQGGSKSTEPRPSGSG